MANMNVPTTPSEILLEIISQVSRTDVEFDVVALYARRK